MWIKVAMGILLIWLILGCKVKDSIVSKKLSNSLELSLKTDKTVYQPKEPITLELNLTNKGDVTFKETFRSAQKYDFVVTRDDKEIWRWSHDRMFAMVLTEFALEPQKSATYRETWAQKGNDGNLVAPGKYNLIGILKTHPEKRSNSLAIKIKD